MNSAIDVFSAFGGIECGMEALKCLGIPIRKYVSSEIKTHAMAISRYNYPDVIEYAGDITKISGYDYRGFTLLMGGSPCQDLSVGNSNGDGLAGLRSGLFYHFVRLLGEMRPTYFLLENVRPKRKEWADEITRILGVNPIVINSASVSAQNRERYYWTNIPGVTQPENRGILLKNILLKEVDPKYILSNKAVEYMLGSWENDGIGSALWTRLNRHASDTAEEKSRAVLASFRKGVPTNCLIERKQFFPFIKPKNKNGVECVGIIPESFKPKGNYLPRERVFSSNGKSRAVTRVISQYPYIALGVAQRGRYTDKGTIEQRIEINGKEKSNCVTRVQKDSMVFLPDDCIIRRFTPVEVERLQTLPDDFTKYGIYDGVVKEVPDTHRYDCVGDGWTKDVIQHILSFMVIN